MAGELLVVPRCARRPQAGGATNSWWRPSIIQLSSPTISCNRQQRYPCDP